MWLQAIGQAIAFQLGMSGFLQDLRYSVRVLLKSPGATAVALLALALGIGVNLTSFTSVNAMILHPLPFPHIERIMTIWETAAKSHSERYAVAPANFLDWAHQSRSYEQVAAYQNWGANLTGTADPARLRAALVSPEFFRVLGMQPALGRTFTAEEAQGARSRVVVVSDGFWRRYLAGARNALGKSLALNGETYTVIGVMPADFDFPLTYELWAPLSIGAAQLGERSEHTLQVLALLKPHVSVQQARTEAERIAARLEQQYPLTNESRGMTVVSLPDSINEVTERFVLILLASAAFTLLLACANVANLQLARAVSREKEIAVRAAMGASRFQIARQLFAESVLIAAAGSVFALLLASWNVALSKSSIPPEAFQYVAGLRTMHVDGYVVLYTIAIAVVTALLCSLPAIFQVLHQRSRTDLNDALKEGGRTSTAAPGRNRLQSLLIVYEVSLALVLLIGAGFMVKMFKGVLTGYYGYDSKNVLQFRISLPSSKYQRDAQVVDFYDRLLPQLETLPGARAAALWGDGATESLLIDGRPEPRPGDPQPSVQPVSEGFLSSLRIPLLKGRFLSQHDRPNSPGVVVISESLARSYWPDSDPIGHRVKLGKNSASLWLTIVGISGDIVQDNISRRPVLAAYVSYTQLAPGSAKLLIRSYGDPTRIATTARAAVRNVDKDLPVYALKSMERDLFEQSSGFGAAASTMSTYAAVALLLAATGIFGVISYFVAQRTHDIGVRMALGAGTRDVLKLTLSRTARLTLRGIAFGTLLGFGLMKLVSSVLYNLVKLDALTFVGCAAVLAAAALLASYLPAYRATQIDPLVALRQE